ncbi:penicillin-binding Tp47 domain C-containing protein [Paratractidigestivibacter sp.]|uniref:penicillin-binding Tp47 domain C-containing protein n=1 Tax=Paratractidigestivibacter sp. TaxID=2847316 RepID=UPI002ACB1761|nr:penicillin-binding Tp47 domain C-containing protein [Paratractidigestivibacter sp.]
MQDQEKLRRHLTSLGGNAARGAVVAALALSMVPTAALAEMTTETGSTATNTVPASAQVEEQTSSEEDYTAAVLASATDNGSSTYDLSKIADGTYEGTAQVAENGSEDNDDEFDGYTVNVSVTVADHKIAGVTVATTAPSDSTSYVNKALTGTKKSPTGMSDRIVADQSTSVDAVSGATFTSEAIKEATANALANAKTEETPVADEYTYGYASLTWAEYWANEAVYNAGSTATSDEVDRDTGSVQERDRGAFDVVTRATSNHGLHRGSFQCTDVIETAEGVEISPSYYPNKTSFVDVDGKTWTISGGKVSDGTNTYTIAGHKVTGTKYVPVKVKTADLEAFKATHAFYANGTELAGGFSENNLSAYTGVVASVDENTNGLKEVTKSGDAFIFSAAKSGSTSGIKDQDLKTATGITATVCRTTEADTENADTFHTGSFGEFLRVDLSGDYGDLGANMQSVTWTYYGKDASRSTALATYGTKFAADNWMHKNFGVQLGLTESARCQLPEGTDGTGYWTVTVHALGYNDYTYSFEATSDNIYTAPTPVTEETKKALQDLYDEASALKESNYTAESWSASAIATELAETKELLDNTELTETAASEQLTHLQAAVDALVKAHPVAGDYLVMNIPYSDFYAAETASNTTSVDVFTSATKSKTTGNLSAGTYHTEDGSEISGVTFAVKVTDSAEGIDWSKFTQVEGTDALATAASYSYSYVSDDEAPATYKEMSADASGKVSFGKTTGAEATVLDGSADAEFSTETSYGDYELDFHADTSVYETLKGATVYGAVVNTTDGYGYGLRSLENIWKTDKHGLEFAWCTGFTSQVHGCPTSSEHYKSIMGKTIGSVTVYTSAGSYQINLGDGIYVPLKSADVSVSAADATDANPTVSVEANLPEGFQAVYTIDGAEVSPATGRSALSFDVRNLSVGQHTLKATDKSGKYAAVSDTFVLSTDKTVAAYDVASAGLVKAEGATDAQLANYLGNIATVSVNGTAYSATGRGAAQIIDAKTGTVNTGATSGMGNAAKNVFDGYGTYTMTVKATGYNKDVEFTFTYEADKAALKSAIANVENDLAEADYSKTSWAALKSAVEAGQKVVDNVAATDDEVAAAAQAIVDARAALVANPLIDLKASIESAEKLSESDYTIATWKNFASALDDAKKVAADAASTDAQVTAAAEALANARKALVHAATASDVTDLKVEIGRVDVLAESDYTADSWKAYQAALAAAKKVEATEGASQDEVQAATKALADARKALVKNAAEQETDNVVNDVVNNDVVNNDVVNNDVVNNTNTTTNAASASGTGASGSKSLPKTSDASLAMGGVAGLGAVIAGVSATLRRRFKR